MVVVLLKVISKFTNSNIAIECHDHKIVQCIPNLSQMGKIWISEGKHVLEQWN